MILRTKLVILKLLAGIFRWGRWVAGAAVLYFLVMEIGFEGSWTPIIIALVVGVLSNWLAKAFQKSAMRVGFEADLVANLGRLRRGPGGLRGTRRESADHLARQRLQG